MLDLYSDGRGEEGLELFPVTIGVYRHHRPLDTESQEQELARILQPFGARLVPWPADEERLRGADAVEDRLSVWAAPSSTGNTVLYWAGHGESDGQDAVLAHARSPRPILHGGVRPEQFLDYLVSRQECPETEGAWAIVIIDACRSDRFVDLLDALSKIKGLKPRATLLVATSADTHAWLGGFTKALSDVLSHSFAADEAIDLRDLATELNRMMPGCPAYPPTDGTSFLRRTAPQASSVVSTTLDVLTEIQTVIDTLTPDEQRHFLPKAAGAELGEQAWYFEGRESERDTILRWLASPQHGMLIVTGRAGTGKSALLGHILLHTRPELSTVLQHAHQLASLPPGIPRPERPFTSTLHAAGASLYEIVDRLAQDIHLTPPDPSVTPQRSIEILLAELRSTATANKTVSILIDALDEAQQPLILARDLLRPLADIPHVKLLVGTRRSTHEGPDEPDTYDTDLLDALGHAARPNPQRRLLTVTQDPEAMRRYLLRRLRDAADRGLLDYDDQKIENFADMPAHQGQEFLYARLAVHEVIHAPALLTEPEPLARATHRDLFARAVDRLVQQQPVFRPLLHALAVAQGRGLPVRDGIWTEIARTLADDQNEVAEQHVHELVQAAAPYLLLDTEHGQTVYRLAHRTFAEYFTWADTAADMEQRHVRITAALTASVSEQQDMPKVHSYLTYHLADHASLGGALGWQALADVPAVLDRLDLTSVTRQGLASGASLARLPLEVAGLMATQHLTRQSAPGFRSLLRQIGMARIGGTYTTSHGQKEQPHPMGALRFYAGPRIPLSITWSSPNGPIQELAAFTTPDGRSLLASSSDGTVHVWDPITSAPVSELRTGGLLAMAAFTGPHGRPLLATANTHLRADYSAADFTDHASILEYYTLGPRYGAVSLWDLSSGRKDGELYTSFDARNRWERRERYRIRTIVAFSTSNGYPLLATVNMDGLVQVWDPVTENEVDIPQISHKLGAQAMTAFTGPDGHPLFATAQNNGLLQVWNPISGTEVAELHTGGTSIGNMVAFTAAHGDPLLVTAHNDNTVQIRDPMTGAEIGELQTDHLGGVQAMAAFVTPDGHSLLATTSGQGAVHGWDPMASFEKPRISRSGKVSVMVDAVAGLTTPNDHHLLAVGSGTKVHMWDPVAGAEVGKPLISRTGIQTMAAFPAPDGRPMLATAGRNSRTVTVWDCKAGITTKKFQTSHTGGIEAITAFITSDDRHVVAIGGSHSTLQIWDPISGTQVGVFKTGQPRGIAAMAAFVTPDGRPFLAAAGRNSRTVHVWDSESGITANKLQTNHTGAIVKIEAITTPDGHPVLAALDSDGLVGVWNPISGTTLSEPLLGRSERVQSITAFVSSNGRPLLVAGGRDGTVRIWDLATLQDQVLSLGTPVRALASLGTTLACITNNFTFVFS